MNGEVFYEEFKNALEFLEASWGRKELVSVWVSDGTFHMALDDKQVALKIPKEED
jgi:hypothetical protein